MAISYLYSGEPMVGTANDDFVIAYKGSTGTDNNTVNGNNGDDLVIGDSSDTWIPGASYLNGSIATAFNLEALTSTWTTGENEMFGDWTIPHTTVMAEATIGQSEYYRIAIGAGQQITIDLDFASNTAIGNTSDLVVELQDSLGNVIASADDSLVTDGGRGSFASSPGSASSYDPYLTFTAPSGGIYYINVRPFGGGPGATFTENNTFVMNVSVTGHAVAASNPVQGADTINGGEGDDALFGQGGGDVINGDGGNDFIDAGSGGDIVHGGEGDDTIYGGDGTEENIHGDNGNDTLVSGGEGHYYGDAGDDLILAGLTAGVNEVLDGGADTDTLDTRTWNGTYNINLVTGATNFGESFINFENVITGNGADTITGTAGANVIATNGGVDAINADAGNDVVAGGDGGDTLDGGADFDILDYRGSSGAVTINLATNSASGGHATGDVISNFEGVWGSVLGDTLTGDGGNNELRGYQGNDILVGGDGNDILDGGLGDDTMTGGIGDDTYYMDSPGDIVNELAGQGTDTLAVGMTYILANGSAIENLATLDPAATTAIDLTGNAGVNLITGNAGANVLTGGAGADTLVGLGGDDTYNVESGDVVTEAIGGGNDAVLASTSFTLAAASEVEQLSTSNTVGTAAINLTGNEFANSIFGNAGVNILSGGVGDDTITAYQGNDMLGGNQGNDTLDGGQGDDMFDGGLDNDTASYGSASSGVVVDLRILAAQNTLGAGNDTLVNIENLSGSVYADALTGNSIDNVLTGGAGADTLVGNYGNDTLYGNQGDDTLDGGAGNDTLDGGIDVDTAVYTSATAGVTVNLGVLIAQNTGGSGTDTLLNIQNVLGSTFGDALTGTGGDNMLTGQSGNDTLVGNNGSDKLYGNQGNDTLDGGLGDDTIDGGINVDTALYGSATAGVTVDLRILVAQNTGGAGTDTVLNIENLSGSAYGDTLTGNSVDNILTGLAGNDTLVGNYGNDMLGGNQGNDTLDGGVGDDLLDGGLDNDTASYGSAASGVQVDLRIATSQNTVGAGNDTLANIENLSGSGFNDTLTGNSIDNVLTGLAGNDKLVGNFGNDTLIGGAGNDTLDGGNGTDVFLFDSALNAATNVDTINGFVVADDTIELKQAIFSGVGAPGVLAGAAFYAGTGAHDADDRVIYDSVLGKIYFDADGLGGSAQVLFAQVAPGLSLTNADFLVIA